MRLRLVLLWVAIAVWPGRSAEAESVGPGASPAGRWLTEDGTGVIEIGACRTGLCGRIVGQSDLLDDQGRVTTDIHGVPHCGLTILHGRPLAEAGHWGGVITNPDDGRDWRCEFWVGADGSLRLRGYVVIELLGQTQTWKPYAGAVGKDCAMTR